MRRTHGPFGGGDGKGYALVDEYGAFAVSKHRRDSRAAARARGRFNASTDDAYVGGDVMVIARQRAGFIAQCRGDG